MGAELDYREIERLLERILGKPAGFEEMVNETVAGGTLFSADTLPRVLGNVAVEQFRAHGQTVGYLCLLLVSAAVLGTLAKAFRSRQISDMGFYMIFLLLSLIMMKSFGTCYELTASVIKDLVDFMRVLMPTFLMAAAVSAYRTSAIVYYEGFLLLIYYLQKMVELLILPGIRTYVLLTFLGNLGKEELFPKAREGLKKLISWGMKAMIGITAGVQVIQGMISPAVDEMKHTMVSKGISSLGSLGNVAQNVTDVILGSGALIKNGIGVVAAVALISICMIPVAEVACYVVFYQILGAAAEPVSDRRLSGAISQIGEGLGLLVKLLFTVCAMFLLTIAIICVMTGGIR